MSVLEVLGNQCVMGGELNSILIPATTRKTLKGRLLQNICLSVFSANRVSDFDCLARGKEKKCKI